MVQEVCSESQNHYVLAVVEEKHTNDDVQLYHENFNMTRMVGGFIMTMLVDHVIIRIGIDI